MRASTPDAVARASARGRPQDGPDTRGPSVLVSRSPRTRNMLNSVFIPPGLGIQVPPPLPISTPPPSLPNQVSRCPRPWRPDPPAPYFSRTQHLCAPSLSLGIQAFRCPSSKHTGVPVPFSSRTQEFPVLSCQPPGVPYPQYPQPRYLATGQAPGTAWGRPGGAAEERPHRPRGGPGSASRAGCGARLSAPTEASQTSRCGDSAGGRGRGLLEPRPQTLRPWVQPSSSHSGLFRGRGFQARESRAALVSESPHPTRTRTSKSAFPPRENTRVRAPSLYPTGRDYHPIFPKRTRHPGSPSG